MTELVRYNAMCVAIAEAKDIDEVKEIGNKAEALRVYAIQAKNRQAEIDCAEIRIRAERRMGEILLDLNPKSRGRPGRSPEEKQQKENELRLLRDAGVGHQLRERARLLARPTKKEFDKRMHEWRRDLETTTKPVSRPFRNVSARDWANDARGDIRVRRRWLSEIAIGELRSLEAQALIEARLFCEIRKMVGPEVATSMTKVGEIITKSRATEILNQIRQETAREDERGLTAGPA